jgi:hypothetical protein
VLWEKKVVSILGYDMKIGIRGVVFAAATCLCTSAFSMSTHESFADASSARGFGLVEHHDFDAFDRPFSRSLLSESVVSESRSFKGWGDFHDHDPHGPSCNPVSAVPEPGTVPIMVSGLALLALVVSRRRSQI